MFLVKKNQDLGGLPPNPPLGSQYGDYFVFPVAGVDDLPAPNPLQKVISVGILALGK